MTTVIKTTKPRAMADIPAAERRVSLLRLLKKLKAVGPREARPLSSLAEKLGYTKYDVYCLVYPKYQLAKSGLVGTAKTDDGGLGAYVTKKGLMSLETPIKVKPKTEKE